MSLLTYFENSDQKLTSYLMIMQPMHLTNSSLCPDRSFSKKLISLNKNLYYDAGAASRIWIIYKINPS
jgi:hypothetical protein